MNKKNKKGFTLTELIVVIVIIAILAAVMIPTYTGIVQKARKSADLQEAKNMNDALTLASVEKGTPKDMEEALSYLYEEGYVLENLNPTASGYNYLWNSKDNTIYYVDKDFNVSYPTNGDKTVSTTNGQSYWLPVAEPSDVTNYQDKGISFCLAKDLKADFAFTQLNNFDTNTFTLTGNISYGTATSPATVAGTVTVDGTIVGTLTVNDANLTVNHYGVIDNVDLIAVASASYDEYGTILTKLEVKQGRAVIQSTGYVAQIEVNTASNDADKAVKVEVAGEVKTLTVTAAASEIKITGIVKTLDAKVAQTVTNTGYIAETATGSVVPTIADGGNQVNEGTSSLTLSIASLSELKDFRDQVNGGRTYEGITINLTDDIDLTGLAWAPISAFYRSNADFVAGTKGFQGTFNGNNHTITGLSNIGFSVNEFGAFSGTNNSTPDGQCEYTYGFFGSVKNATIKNIVFSGVSIDASTAFEYKNLSLIGDSVAACVGFSYGSLDISGITVSGSIKGADGIGGIVGRAYGIDVASVITVSSCTNNATVYGKRENSYSHVAGILGYINKGAVTISSCTNNGNLTNDSNHVSSLTAGILTIGNGTLTITTCTASGTKSSVGGHEYSLSNKE